MEQSGKRLSGRRVTMAFGLFVLTLVSIVIGFWFVGRAPTGPIHSFTPVSERRVLLVREGYRQKNFIHLSHVDVERGPLWSVPFHDVPRSASPVVAAGRALLWVRNDLGGLEIDAHDLESGEFVFRTSTVTMTRSATPEVAIAVAGSRVIAAYHHEDTHLLVIDAGDGRVVADHPLAGESHVPSIRASGNTVIVRTRDGIERVVDPADGTLGLPPPGLVEVPLPTRPTLPFSIRVEESGRVVPMLVPAKNGSVFWIVAGRSFAAVDASDGHVVGSSGPADFVTGPLGRH